MKTIYPTFLVMVFAVLLCTFIQISSTQPVLNDDDEDQTQLDNSVYIDYPARVGRIPYSHHNQHNNPGNVYVDPLRYDLFNQDKRYVPDNAHLTKRVIMLPRVGRR